MKAEPSKLARLVIAYYEKFGGHVPESALRALDAGDLAPILQNALATDAPLSETGWNRAPPIGFSPRGCCIVLEEPENPTPAKGPDDEWLQ